MEIGIVILAAGASARMGTPKQLLQWQGQTLLERTIGMAEAVHLGPVMVVLGANSEIILDQLSANSFQWVKNEAWATGMGSSVSIGLEALLKQRPNLSAVLCLLVDQPLITSKDLQLMVKTWQKENPPIVAAKYQDTVGVPALFDHRVFSDLLALSGERGAKSVLSRYANELIGVVLPAAALDVDTPEAWRAFLKKHSGQ